MFTRAPLGVYRREVGDPPRPLLPSLFPHVTGVAVAAIARADILRRRRRKFFEVERRGAGDERTRHGRPAADPVRVVAVLHALRTFSPGA